MDSKCVTTLSFIMVYSDYGAVRRGHFDSLFFFFDSAGGDLLQCRALQLSDTSLEDCSNLPKMLHVCQRVWCSQYPLLLNVREYLELSSDATMKPRFEPVNADVIVLFSTFIRKQNKKPSIKIELTRDRLKPS